LKGNWLVEFFNWIKSNSLFASICGIVAIAIPAEIVAIYSYPSKSAAFATNRAELLLKMNDGAEVLRLCDSLIEAYSAFAAVEHHYKDTFVGRNLEDPIEASLLEDGLKLIATARKQLAEATTALKASQRPSAPTIRPTTNTNRSSSDRNLGRRFHTPKGNSKPASRTQISLPAAVIRA
jgi:hypothetical protein